MTYAKHQWSYEDIDHLMSAVESYGYDWKTIQAKFFVKVGLKAIRNMYYKQCRENAKYASPQSAVKCGQVVKSWDDFKALPTDMPAVEINMDFLDLGLKVRSNKVPATFYPLQ